MQTKQITVTVGPDELLRSGRETFHAQFTCPEGMDHHGIGLTPAEALIHAAHAWNNYVQREK